MHASRGKKVTEKVAYGAVRRKKRRRPGHRWADLDQIWYAGWNSGRFLVFEFRNDRLKNFGAVGYWSKFPFSCWGRLKLQDWTITDQQKCKGGHCRTGHKRTEWQGWTFQDWTQTDGVWQGWTLQDWTMTDQFGRGGHDRTGQWRTTVAYLACYKKAIIRIVSDNTVIRQKLSNISKT